MKKKLTAENTPLKTEVKNGVLKIIIGVETLAWASVAENNGPLNDCEVDYTKLNEWAKDVASEIEREDHVGEMPIHRFFDEMIQRAADNGSLALEYKYINYDLEE